MEKNKEKKEENKGRIFFLFNIVFLKQKHVCNKKINCFE